MSEMQDLRDEIARTRAELGDTVEALAAKTDVKARAREAVSGVADDATEFVDRTQPAIAIAVTVAAIVGLLVWLARRRRS